MTRKYTQRKRAEQQAETRRRIAQAALDLHRLHGPARTTFSMVAERADVQRHTLYAHFPDEKSLLQACSGLHLEQDPPPDPAAWSNIIDRRERLITGLRAIYSWYERNDQLFAAVLRDSEFHQPTREISTARLAPTFAAWRVVFSAASDSPAVSAMLDLALSFHSWRTVAKTSGLGLAAAGVMANAIMAAEAR